MKILLLFFFFITFNSSLVAQEYLDSLQTELKHTSDIEKKSNLYIDIAWEYLQMENDSALYFSDLGYQYAKEHNYSFGMITNLEMKGLYLESVKNDYASAIDIYMDAVAIADKTNDNYISSLHLALGVLFNQIKTKDKAKEYYKRAIDNARKHKQKDVLKLALINLGIIYESENNLENALKVFNESLKIDHPDRLYNDATYINLANVYLKQNKPKSAYDVLIKSLKNIKNNNPDYRQNYTVLLDTKLILNELTGVDTLTIIVENFERNTSRLQEKLGLFKTLSDVSLVKKDYNKALFYKNKYILYSDSIYNKINSESIFNAEQKYQSAKKQLIIDENKLQQKLYNIIFILLGLGLISLAYFYLSNKKKNKVLKDQNKVISKTLALNETLLKETHHRVKNSLQMISSLLYLQSENIEDKKAAASVKDGQIRVKSMALIHQKLYQKDNLTGVEVSDYVHDLAESIFQSHNISNNDIKLSISVEKMILDIDTITPIGIIINELIVNALKHAFTDAKKDAEIHISLLKEKNILVLKVGDNGKGFNLGEKKEKSFGLKLINSLSRKLKADLFITNKKGTLVELRIKRFIIK